MSKPPVKILACALAATLLAACGGGDDDDAAAGGAGGGGAAVALTCDTTKYVAGSVEAPTSAQVTAYAGTYNGGEGSFGPNPGDPFVKSADAAVVLGADGTISYKGTSYTITSACIEKASGSFGKVLYVIAGSGHIDLSDQTVPDLGRAWGVSLANGTTLFRNGVKQ
jgi:hypothetical protein